VGGVWGGGMKEDGGMISSDDLRLGSITTRVVYFRDRKEKYLEKNQNTAIKGARGAEYIYTKKKEQNRF